VAGQLIVSGRKSYADLVAAPPVALGGTPGTGPSASGQPQIVGFKQSLRLQPVEVELRLVAGDADRFCRFIAGSRVDLGSTRTGTARDV
jgi:hypothetical protein